MFGFERRISLALCFFAATMGSACQGNTAQPVEAQAVKPPLGQGTPPQNLVNAYLTVQARLALDDFAGAKSAYSSVLAANKPAELPVTPELRKRIDQAATSGAAAANIVAARTAFAALSEAVLSWFGTQTNPLADAITLAHCPMALEGKGSKWLQLGAQLRNPYFGAEMLTCGTVENTIQPGKRL